MGSLKRLTEEELSSYNDKFSQLRLPISPAAHFTPLAFRRHRRRCTINQQTRSAPAHLKASRAKVVNQPNSVCPSLAKSLVLWRNACRCQGRGFKREITGCALLLLKHTTVVCMWLDTRCDFDAWLRHNQSRFVGACEDQSQTTKACSLPVALWWEGLLSICVAWGSQRGLFHCCLTPALCWYWCCTSRWTSHAEVLSTWKAQLHVDYLTKLWSAVWQERSLIRSLCDWDKKGEKVQ